MTIIRFIVATFACALLLFSSVTPAMAVSGSTKSSPTSGAAQLDGVLNNAKETLKSEPLPDKAEQDSADANDLNAAQKGAKVKANTPANSRGAETVEGSIEDTLEDILP